MPAKAASTVPVTATKLQREAHIDVFRPPRRLRLIYMPFPDLPDEGTVVVEDFLLDRDPDGGARQGVSAVTVLRLMGSGVPGDRRLALPPMWPCAAAGSARCCASRCCSRGRRTRGPEFTRLTGL